MNLPSSINGWRPNRPEPSTPFREAIGSVGYEFRWVIIDTWMLTWRMLIHYRRNPEMLASITISPVMFLLLFNYVFGGAISGGGEFNYLDYLVPGVLIQNNVFTVMQAGVGLADDLQKGVIDRYRSLPMARSSVIAGRILATTIVAYLTVYGTLAVAMIMGMRFHGGFWPAFFLPFVVAAFSFGFAWISALAGVSFKSVQAVSSVTFIVAIPLTFLSSAFVPIETMPGWLQAFTKINPITIVIDLNRNLAQGGPIASLAWQTALWIAIMVFGIGSLATWRYKRIQ